MAATQCKSTELRPGMWARRVSLWSNVRGPYRKVEKVTECFSYGNPQIRIRFTNGDRTYSALTAVWEIDGDAE